MNFCQQEFLNYQKSIIRPFGDIWGYLEPFNLFFRYVIFSAINYFAGEGEGRQNSTTVKTCTRTAARAMLDVAGGVQKCMTKICT